MVTSKSEKNHDIKRKNRDFALFFGHVTVCREKIKREFQTLEFSPDLTFFRYLLLQRIIKNQLQMSSVTVRFPLDLAPLS